MVEQSTSLAQAERPALSGYTEPSALPQHAGKVLSRLLPKKIRLRHIEFATRLYDYIPPVCWLTEVHLAEALGTNRRQIRIAKAYLEHIGKVRVELRPNGRRANPVHTLIKTSPIEPIVEGGEGRSRLNWRALDGLSAGDLNEMTLEALFDIYEEIGLPFFPLHYAKFKPDGTPYCSCKRGKNCPYIGKHPVTEFKHLDFTTRGTYSEIRDYWFERDINYNVGFRTDAFMVVDVDYRSGGAESLGLLEEELGELPATLTVRTGNGRHLYLRNARGVSGSVVGLWAGLDIKAGAGSFVVVPPSLHKSGATYAWESVGEPEDLPEPWRYATTDGKTVRGETGGKRAAQHSGLGDRAALPRVLTPDYLIPVHHRNNTLFRIASRERGRGGDYQHVLATIAEVNRANTAEPLTTAELEYIAGSACKYPTNAEKPAGRNGRAIA